MPILPSERQEADDHDGSADHRQSACAHADLGDQTDHFAPIVDGGERYPDKRLPIEQSVIADPPQRGDRPLDLAG